MGVYGGNSVCACKKNVWSNIYQNINRYEIHTVISILTLCCMHFETEICIF